MSARQTGASFFVDAAIDVAGRAYRFTKREGDRLVTRGSYWHGPGDPSSWLAVAAFRRVRAKHPALGEGDALALTARALVITVEKLRSTLRWHEQYVRWHDGDDSYRVLEADEDGD